MMLMFRNMHNQHLCENCDIKKGGGGFQLNVKMTLSVQKSVWRCPLSFSIKLCKCTPPPLHSYEKDTLLCLSSHTCLSYKHQTTLSFQMNIIDCFY